MYDDRSTVCRAKLDNGEIVAYQLCCDIDSPTEDEEHFEFIGEGVIHSIDGRAHPEMTDRHMFYQRRITPLSKQINPDGTLKYSKPLKPFNRYTALTERKKS